MKNIILEHERIEQYHESEEVMERSFYNVYMPGCDEHLLLHNLRNSPDYRPELSYLALLKKKIIGGIFVTNGVLIGSKGQRVAILSFGPLGVDPLYQKQGVGELLVRQVLLEAKTLGYPALVIIGVPTYYPRLGFMHAEVLNLYMSDGAQFPALMGYEFEEGFFKKMAPSKYEEAPIYQKPNTQKEVDAFDKLFPPLKKEIRPGQWKHLPQ